MVMHPDAIRLEPFESSYSTPAHLLAIARLHVRRARHAPTAERACADLLRAEFWRDVARLRRQREALAKADTLPAPFVTCGCCKRDYSEREFSGMRLAAGHHGDATPVDGLIIRVCPMCTSSIAIEVA
jgi:hypothetical protein